MIKIIQHQKDIKNITLPFFAKEDYLKCKSDFYGWIADKKFILSFTIFKKFIFTRLVFTTQTIYRTIATREEEKIFLNQAIALIKKEKLCDVIFKPQPSAIFQTYPSDCDAFRWGSYAINITSNREEMITKMKPSQRTYTRKAIKLGAKVEEASIEEFFSLANETLKRQKIELLLSKNEIELEYKRLYPKYLKLFKVSFEGIIQGVLFVFFDHKSAFAKYAGSIPHPLKGSLKLLHLEAMLYLAKKHNIQTYDFIGAIPDVRENTKEAGIQRFKKEFGAYQREGYQFSKIIIPWKYHLFTIMLKTMFKLKGIKYLDPVEKYKNLSRTGLKI